MAWIESHSDLADHPKLNELCFNLAIKKHEAVGHLHLLWHFAIKYAWKDGDLEKFSPRVICEAVGWDKDCDTFINALRWSGWLDADSMKIHDWFDYAGKLVKDRIYNKKRRKTALNDVLHRKVVATLPYPTLPKDKDIRSNDTIVRTSAPPKPKTWEPDLFEKFWNAYPRKIAKGSARKAWNRIKPDSALVDRMLHTISISRVKLGWDGPDARFTPYPASWLNSERFNDILEVAGKPVADLVSALARKKKELQSIADKTYQKQLEQRKAGLATP